MRIKHPFISLCILILILGSFQIIVFANDDIEQTEDSCYVLDDGSNSNEIIADEQNVEDPVPQQQHQINIISSDEIPMGLHYRMKEEGEE